MNFKLDFQTLIYQAKLEAIDELLIEYKNTPYIDKIILQAEKITEELGCSNFDEALEKLGVHKKESKFKDFTKKEKIIKVEDQEVKWMGKVI